MIQKLIAKIQKTNAPIVVGLDPMLNYIPEQIKAAAFAEFGETLEGAAEAVWQYNKAIVDKVYDLIPAVKPQIAMYEQFGIPGLQAFKRTVDYCKEKDLVVIGDVKRGDIGSTSAAYATAHLGQVQVGSQLLTPFGEDFATVNPYLGSDGIKPFLEVCKEEKKGIFILVKTSNPSSGEFDVLTRIKIPFFSSLQTSRNGLIPSDPRYGLTVAKSSPNGVRSCEPTCTCPRCAVAYAAEVEPMSPRFTSPITTRSFSLQ